MTEHPFRPRPPWWGGDLQTLRNSLAPAPPPLPGETLLLAMADGSGDRLCALHHPGRQPDGPLIVLIHGLSGSQDSTYMQLSARYFHHHGFPVLRLNTRGAGPSRPTCRLQSHAGRSQDLADALATLPAELTAHGVVVVGFSLGGNLALKFAAEHGARPPLRAVVTVSAPLDLAATSRNMLRPRNYLYNQKLLRDYKRESLGHGAEVNAEERRAVLAARNFVDIDNDFVAPRNGFRDAHDYWLQCQAKGFLAEIAVPALLVQARDDPMVPIAPYLSYPWADNPLLRPVLPERGGHVGFHGREGRPWYLDLTRRFLGALA
ncbi:MAG: alpha/beta fold hydrolase [Alphaproteobacteria bacterium]|nr:alpha/beta fold hydrolase [Alphaproteobacteria bacterium]MDP6813110.1 alpha/beta fold hydrolase [Alphaproteobacteria bacterium]